MTESNTASSSTASDDDYVLERLSTDGRRRLELGRGDSLDLALDAFEQARAENVYLDLLLRQGDQRIAFAPARPLVHKPGHA